MGEILPDGSIGGYEGYCAECKSVIKTNMQGNEIGTHRCIPEWIIKYDKANYQSGAGKAVRILLGLIKDSDTENERLRKQLQNEK